MFQFLTCILPHSWHLAWRGTGKTSSPGPFSNTQSNSRLHYSDLRQAWRDFPCLFHQGKLWIFKGNFRTRRFCLKLSDELNKVQHSIEFLYLKVSLVSKLKVSPGEMLFKLSVFEKILLLALFEPMTNRNLGFFSSSNISCYGRNQPFLSQTDKVHRLGHLKWLFDQASNKRQASVTTHVFVAATSRVLCVITSSLLPKTCQNSKDIEEHFPGGYKGSLFCGGNGVF